MASITQTIPNYTSGLSEQPDHFKNPGQVSEALNVVPDITTGLVKRPGSQFIKTLLSEENVTWFHYYRDQTEQYLGQIKKTANPNDNSYNPIVKMWDIKTGESRTVSKDSNALSEINSYLRHSGDEDLQFLTINDYTYITNRNVMVAMDHPSVSATTERPHAYAAFIDLKKTANSRQYSLNLNSPTNTTTTTLTTATRIKNKHPYPTHTWYNQAGGAPSPGASAPGTVANPTTGGIAVHTRHFRENWTYADRNDGSCPDIGTAIHNSEETNIKIFNASNTDITSNRGGRKNLIWRWTVKGVSGRHPDDGDTDVHGHDYVCTYEYDMELLHGGEGWQVGDYISFRQSDFGGSGWGTADKTDVTYFMEIESVSTEKVLATVSSAGDGLIRPVPVGFDQDTSVTTGSILGGLEVAIGNILGSSATNVQQIGNGLYLNSTTKFNVSTTETDLMNILTSEVNDVGKLPTQCKHGYIVKIANSDADEDDYYMRFQGHNDADGPGTWQECAEPGIADQFKKSTMPLQLVRDEFGGFEIKQVDWPKRDVGDATTNPAPSFVGQKLNKVLFWRNRICLLSSTNVIASQPGDDNITLPSFWGKTALVVSPEDVIDLSASSDNPAFLFDGMETVQGLLLFSENQQFLLTAEAEVLTPETAKLTALSTYNYNTSNPPIALGVTVGFLDNAGSHSRFFEMTNLQRGLVPEIIEQSVVAPKLLPKNINLVTNSRENTYVLFAVRDTNTVYGYRYFDSGEKRLQSAWFKWTLYKNIKYHCIIDDTYYAVLSNNNLIKFDLKSEVNTASINTYPIHLDNYSLIGSDRFIYNVDDNLTTLDVSGLGLEPNDSIALINPSSGDDLGRYKEVTISNSSATITGDWRPINSDDKYCVGYNFDMQIKLPTIYATGGAENKASDINASLVIHRLKLALGAAGVYETTLERVGKSAYTELVETSLQDGYIANTSPWVEQKIHTVPAYERNKNLTVYLKSTHPSPATLHSMSWEGDYSNKFYQRA